MTSELTKYIKEHWAEIMKDAMPSMKKEGIVENEQTGERWGFIGHGCGITYLSYRKNNKKAEMLAKLASYLHMNDTLDWFYEEFTPEQKNYYEKIGCPLGAIWTQDIVMQQAYYNVIKKFADEHNINVEVKSFLD